MNEIRVENYNELDLATKACDFLSSYSAYKYKLMDSGKTEDEAVEIIEKVLDMCKAGIEKTEAELVEYVKKTGCGYIEGARVLLKKRMAEMEDDEDE